MLTGQRGSVTHDLRCDADDFIVTVYDDGSTGDSISAMAAK